MGIADMGTHAKKLVRLVVRIAVATLLLTWVFSQVNIREFFQTVKAARWQYLAAVWLSTVAFFWLRSLTLQIALKKQGCKVRMTTLFGATAVTALYAMILPEIVSTGVKWFILKKDTGKGTNVLSSMLYNQLSIIVTMILFGLAALAVTNPSSILLDETPNRWLLPVVCGLSLAATVVFSILVLNKRSGGAVIKALKILARPLPHTVRAKVEQILEQIALFQTAGPRFHLAVAAINVTACIVGCFFIYLASAKAAGISVPVVTLVWLCAAVFLLGRLPISVANLGVREVTLVGILSLYGVEKTSALLMSMVLFSSLIFMAAVGAAFQICWVAKANKT
ncbi:MAG: flippase-like domain-containing protein [Phycisphaerales bacterium]|nr:MAG: flippase-like domain-containing protein [Phycisphaerales bacterium]